MTELSEAVTQSEAGWDFHCPRPFGCGDAEGPWRSLGWDTKKAATSRGRQHLGEHDGDGTAPELDDFRTNQERGAE